MFGYRLVKEEDWDYMTSLNISLHKEIVAKEGWKRLYDRAISDYAECRGDINKAHALIASLTSELQRVRGEKEELERQIKIIQDEHTR